jgi:hypothetical protein
MTEQRVKEAEFETDRARARLLATLNELSHQFEPQKLMQEAWEKAKDKGADLAEDAVDAVRARPLAASGVIAAITMFLVRGPLIELAGKIFSSSKNKSRGKNAARQKDTETAE